MDETKYEMSWFRKHNELLKDLKERDATIALLRSAVKSALLTLEEDTVPSPFVAGARNRMVKTIEMLQLAL